VNDNARLHRIRLVLETLNLQEIQHFQLPAGSPDFNPIETWKQIPQEEINNLIRRIREVIRVRRRNTDYLKLKQKLFNLILILFNLVARWPHGCRRQCSEVAVPALVGSNLTEGGGIFSRKKPPPGHGCVCMSFRG
jgi:hypothetical protein